MNIGFENETTEFKESIAQLDKGVKGLTAMLNRSNKGTVYFGVNDKGEVIGMEVGPSTFEKIRNAIRDDIKPRIIADIDVLTTDDGKKYVSVSAKGNDTPYSFKDMYFIRHAASNETASPEIVANLVLSRGYDTMREIPSYEEQLKFDTLFDMLSSRGYHPRAERGFMASIGLLTRDEHYNINAWILSDNNNILMQVVEFAGSDRSEFLLRNDFGNQCMFMAMRNILDYIRSRNETRIDVSEGERKEVNLFDYDCFREAWINACVHNAWRTTIPPMVLIFDDRIEVDSVGGIPFNLHLNEFYEGRSYPVNESLFRISNMLGFTEHSGRGVPTIVGKYGRSSITIDDQSVRVTIPFAFTPSYVESRRNAMLDSSELTDAEKAVIEMIRKDRSIKISEMAESLGMNVSAVKRVLASLKEKKIIVNEGTNRSSVWKVLI